MESRRIQFSLIELLVVIAILAVLMSLLAPSLNHVIYTSRNFSCSNNLKGLGVGFNVYTEDFNDYYPAKKQQHGDPRRWGDMMGYNSLVGNNWSVPHIIRPYFIEIGQEFVCSAYGTDTSNGEAGIFGAPGQGLEAPVVGNPSIQYLDFTSNGGIVHTPNALRWRVELSYLYYAHFNMDGSSPEQKFGEPIKFLNTNFGGSPHPTMPESLILFSDQTYLRQSFYNTGDHQLWTTHAPPPGSEYQMVTNYGSTAPGSEVHYLQADRFVSNYAYQDGSVRTVEGHSHAALRGETHTESYRILLPKEEQ